jgi:general stress protein YciG
MDAVKQREIASKGGKAVSQDRAHMSAIGRKGGESSRGKGAMPDHDPHAAAPGVDADLKLAEHHH